MHLKIKSMVILVLASLLLTSCVKFKESNSKEFDSTEIQQKIEETLASFEKNNNDQSDLLTFNQKMTDEDSSSFLYWLDSPERKADLPFVFIKNKDKSINIIIYDNKSNFCLLNEENIVSLDKNCFIYDDYKLIQEVNQNKKIYLSNYSEDVLIAEIKKNHFSE